MHRLEQVQQFPVSPAVLWQFISDPANLAVITPTSMRFKVLSEEKVSQIYTGQRIRYTVSPLMRIPLQWETKIIAVDAPRSFIDKQIRGPYAFWEHTHILKEITGGVEMTDVVHYAISPWLGGSVSNAWIVSGKLKNIFAYRRKVLTERFGTVIF
ncbi:MAG: SRPBCC family protein [Chitinophagales bacterium]